ncbi:MAG TPA: cobaltochelatase subunit CobN, partial [Woeseiaceae bacterium]
PEVGIYHPHMRDRVTDNLRALPEPAVPVIGTVGLLLMRSYVLAGNVRHYDAVIDALGQRGLRVIPAFASGLDARPAVAKFFRDDHDNHKTRIDALVSLTGFSLVGGPAYNDSKAAEDMLAELDIPYIAAHGTEFQSLHAWESSASGLLPVETTMMVALPELDGAIGPTLFAGRAGGNAEAASERDMQPHPERIAAMASRIERLVRLRKTPRSERKIAVVLFNFPPNGGATGTAAYLSVYRSLFNTLRTLQAEGYQVDLPADADDLRQRILTGNAMQYGSDANVYARVAVDDHVRREPWLDDIEKQWGPAPGRHQSDGNSIFVLGERFGNVLVGIQPAFGYEGDPMRLLFEQGLAPTHAFAAFYRHLRDDFDADAVLHFGTHGALEFMPGKQTGMSSACWPDRLIGHLPNYYLYAANNPSEGTIAKRRSGATLISYLTPPVTRAGLYRGLADLQSSIDRWRELEPTAEGEREQLGSLIQSQAAAVDLCDAAPAWSTDLHEKIAQLTVDLDELRNELIPHGMHVLGEPPSADERTDLLAAVAEMAAVAEPPTENGSDARPADQLLADRLQEIDRQLGIDSELPAIVRALDGAFIRPVPGGDLIRTPEILPTGRNLHGFDPYRIPT